jgi:L-iditol 2-dehydrogenase
MSSDSTSDTNKPNIAVYTNPAHDLKLVKTEIPEPKEGEVIVHIKATGICGRIPLSLEQL